MDDEQLIKWLEMQIAKMTDCFDEATDEHHEKDIIVWYNAKRSAFKETLKEVRNNGR